MKRGIYLTAILFGVGLILLSSCKKDDVVIDNTQTVHDPDPDDSNPDNPDDGTDGSMDSTSSTVDEINTAFIFNNATFKTGTSPANSNLGDLKINKDTINIWPGIKNRIEILNHTGIAISGVLVHLTGAGGYHDVAIETEESNDTLTVFYVDLDPEGLDLPLNNNILIKPTDGLEQVIDEFDHPLHVDVSFDDTVSGNSNSSTCTPAYNNSFFWIYTIKNNSFSDAPGYSIDQEFTVDGCCQSGSSSITCHPAPENASVNVTEVYSYTATEVINFYDEGGGDLGYILAKTFNDYWPEDTDFCSETPGYRLRKPEIDTTGKFSVDQSASSEDYAQIIVNSIDFSTQELLDTGFPPRLQVNENNPNVHYILGCRFFIYTNFIEGDEFLSVYENLNDSDLWYD